MNNQDANVSVNQEIITQHQQKPPVSLAYIFFAFLKIGATSFGGFMALISVVENLIVEKEKLLTHEDMLDGVSLASILPGPTAVNVVVYVGYRLRGMWGALVSGISVLLPTFIFVLGFSIVYFQWGEIPQINKFFEGFIPAIAAIIFSAAWNMGKKTIKNWQGILLAVASGIILKFGGGFYTTLLIILVSGILGCFFYKDALKSTISTTSNSSITINNSLTKNNLIIGFSLLICFLLLYISPLPFFIDDNSLANLFIIFSGMSLMLFGGGYVFIPLIQEIVVNQYQWITQTDFVNGIAIGQVTPGPIMITSAFIGYKVQGILGALVGTIGMFFPSALLMVISSNFLDKIKSSIIIQAALKGIRPAVVGMIFVAGIVFAQTAQIHWGSLVIFAISIFSIWKLKLEVVFIIPIAGILGLLLYR
ncbi:chromate transport protein ChrA [Geminocystis sp. NIES-3708]|uniref:chromate efflux transporter n=1 Tax=Geminocystis sp. NIES-3708 TaxID=1615909 RepID=UPI0005FC8A5F|nr:chromate efflux transporter [Geminocystis sp. NIES-3708]BAQ61725.1 chromate transport protein ChrA [Geminocystis sp. NIES-3708]